MIRPRLLDLFCGAGGCSVGYHRAGFDCVGVDNRPMPRYPYDFIQTEAVGWLERNLNSDYLAGFDVIHASPPCQAYSAGARMRNGHVKQHPKLIEPVRDLLKAWGGIYVIENVPEAPLINPTVLCGSLFGLDVRRHRGFESNTLLLSMKCMHVYQPLVVGVYGDHPEDSVIRKGHPAIRARSIEHAREVMGIDWMTWAEIKEAIPPAYTQYIGEQLLTHLRAGVQ